MSQERGCLSTFESKELAAIAYNEAAVICHNEFAKLNNILGETECL